MYICICIKIYISLYIAYESIYVSPTHQYLIISQNINFSRHSIVNEVLYFKNHFKKFLNSFSTKKLSEMFIIMFQRIYSP